MPAAAAGGQPQCSVDDLAETLQAVGDLQRECELHEQTLTARHRVPGDNTPAALASIDTSLRPSGSRSNCNH
jgi:hypothetical protein